MLNLPENLCMLDFWLNMIHGYTSLCLCRLRSSHMSLMTRCVMNAMDPVVMVAMLLTSVGIFIVYATTASTAGLPFTLPLVHRTIAASSRRTETDPEQSTSKHGSPCARKKIKTSSEVDKCNPISLKTIYATLLRSIWFRCVSIEINLTQSPQVCCRCHRSFACV